MLWLVSGLVILTTRLYRKGFSLVLQFRLAIEEAGLAGRVVAIGHTTNADIEESRNDWLVTAVTVIDRLI